MTTNLTDLQTTRYSCKRQMNFDLQSGASIEPQCCYTVSGCTPRLRSSAHKVTPGCSPSSHMCITRCISSSCLCNLAASADLFATSLPMCFSCTCNDVDICCTYCCHCSCVDRPRKKEVMGCSQQTRSVTWCSHPKPHPIMAVV